TIATQIVYVLSYTSSYVKFTHEPILTIFFFFNAPAPTEFYTLSLHDALPICVDLAQMPEKLVAESLALRGAAHQPGDIEGPGTRDRKSTRLNSSHSQISYAVFCLKKKKNKYNQSIHTHPFSSL